MKGDFTRFTFDRSKHYAGVLKQQGRVDLDADWNEYVEIQAYLDRTEARDVIGPCGAPKHGGGFKIELKPGGQDLSISAGRIYVDGLLVELEETTDYLNQDDYPHPPALNPQEGRTDLVYLDVWQRHVTAIEAPEIREVALNGPDTATRIKTVGHVKVKEGVAAAHCGNIGGWPPSASGGRLSSDVKPAPPSEDPCLIAPGGGYRGLENRLYRVEIHDPGNLGTATFKWSRDNGALVFAITEFVSSDTVKVRRLKWDEVLALRVGDWVEVLDDEHELKGLPGTLAEISAIDEAKQTITLSRSVSGYDIKGYPRVRRWDQAQDAIDTAGGPIELEDGVWVSFSGSDFRTGDYWAFAARTITGSVEKLDEAPPRGIVHHYCPLALIVWQAGGEVYVGGAAESLKEELAQIELAMELLAEIGGTVEEAAEKLHARAEEVEALLDELRAAGETGETLIRLEREAEAIKWALQALEETGDVDEAIEALAAQREEVVAELEAGVEDEVAEMDWQAEIRDCRRIFPPLTELRGNCCTVTVGDGLYSHGQYDDIQEAIDSLPPRGGRVCILPGLYYPKEPVRISGRTNVVVSGCKPHTWLRMKGDRAAFLIANSTTIRIEGLRFQLAPGVRALAMKDNADVRVEDNLIVVMKDQSGEETTGAQEVIYAEACHRVAIRQNGMRGGGIRIVTGSSNLVIEGNDIARGPGHGIAFATKAIQSTANVPYSRIENVIIRGNTIAMMAGSGIAVDATPNLKNPASLIATDDLVIENNTIRACARGATEGDGDPVAGGIVLAGGKLLHIQRNRIEGCGPQAILPAPVENEEPEPDVHPAGTIGTPELQPEVGLAAMGGASPSETLAVQPGIEPRTFARPVPGLTTHSEYLDVTVVEDPTVAPVAGIYVFQSEGLDISHNRILNNGSPQVSARAAGRQGGIIVKQASIQPLQAKVGDDQILTFSNGYPAVKIHDNIVIVPRGPALQIAGIGPMAITANHLTSLGTFPVEEQDEELPLQALGTVQIINLGVADELLGFFSGFGDLVGTQTTVAVTESIDLSSLRFDGSVLFSDNQVTLNLAQPERELTYVSVLVVSMDDVGFHDNQLDAVLPGRDALFADALVLGLRARASGNAFKETIGRCYFSYAAAGLINTAMGNQGNHCFLISGPDPSKQVDQGNIAFFCMLDKVRLAELMSETALVEEVEEEVGLETLKAAAAYRRILNATDVHYPELLKTFRTAQTVKVQRLTAEKAVLDAQPGVADWQVEAVERELAATGHIHTRLDNMVTFEPNLPE
jgi:hypothetical protein